MISIIYVNYKTAPLIVDSIRSVKEKTVGVSYEIIVVDNASGDHSLEMIQAKYPEVICVQSPENLGFGRANNLGLEKAKGDSILFLNPDTILQNDALSEMENLLNSSDKIGACGGNLYDEEGKPTTSLCRRYPSFIGEFLSIFYISPISFPYVKSSYFNFEGKPISVASIIGADLMVKRSVLDKVGGFDADFFMNFEETELCYRITHAGFKIYSVPSAKITHLEGRASYIKQSRLSFLYEGQYIYFRKLYGKQGAKLIYSLTQLKNGMRFLLFVLLASKKKRAYWKMKYQTNKDIWNSEKIKNKVR